MTPTAFTNSGSMLGTRVQRLEDPHFLRGDGTYISNMQLPETLHLGLTRSVMAHAVISSIDTEEAQAMHGVVDVITGTQLGLPPVAQFIVLNENCSRPPVAIDRVRFVGDIVALVLAESAMAAEDGAGGVIVDYDPLPVVVDAEQALLPGAPQLFESVPGNLAAGSSDGTDVLADADVVVGARFVNQRMAVVPMEGNAIYAIPGEDGGLTVYVSTQLPHMFAGLAAPLLGLDPAAIRVIAPDVGGGFGGKAGVLPEHHLAMLCALRSGRPVKWIESRNENLLNMHGRGQVQYVQLGLRSSGEFTGMRCRMIGDAGAYGGFGGSLAMTLTRLMVQGVYKIPAIAYDVAVAVTNTANMGGFRGAGRPEAAAMLERIIDIAADELGIDPVEIRRRNLLDPSSFPLTTVMGADYDSGDYLGALDAALEAAGYESLLAEQARRRERGDIRLLGIGVSVYVEVTAAGGGSEYASVEVNDDGSATVLVGTSGHGQGHATSFAMIVADQLGIPVGQVTLVQSDTGLIPRGNGTGGSRSLQLGGSAVQSASIGLMDRARRLVADMLEADANDIVVHDGGRIGVAGAPASAVTWTDIAAAANASGEPLRVAFDQPQRGGTYPFGAHVAVVEVDSETGRIELVRHIAVDDCGKILNPLIVEGQQHGGIASGVSQVLWEAVTYDDEGNPLTSTLAEYLMPSAAEFPSFEASNTETPTPLNPLGAKGIGESGTIGATPAVHNAVVDALSHLGVRHIDMPCTPERVWRAIDAAVSGRPESAWREPEFDFDALPQQAAAADVAEHAL